MEKTLREKMYGPPKTLREKIEEFKEPVTSTEGFGQDIPTTTSESTPAVASKKDGNLVDKALDSAFTVAKNNAIFGSMLAKKSLNFGKKALNFGKNAAKEVKDFAVDASNDPKDAVASRIPFMESNFEKELKVRLKNFYPLTDDAMKVINTVNTKDAGEEGVTNEIEDSSGGELDAIGVYKAYRGKKTHDVAQKAMPLLSRLPAKVLSTIVGESITLESLEERVAMHEFLHAMSQRSDFDWQDFIDDWDKSMTEVEQDQEMLDFQREVMQTIVLHPYYGDLYWENQAEEMFSFYGAGMGDKGIEKMPEPLRKYYSNIFK